MLQLKEKITVIFFQKKNRKKESCLTSEGMQTNKGGAIAEFILPFFVCQPVAYLRFSFYWFWSGMLIF